MTLRKVVGSIIGILLLATAAVAADGAVDLTKVIRAGMIGLDTSHAEIYNKQLRAPDAPPEFATIKVVAAYPGGSPDIPRSRDRLKRFTDIVRGMDIEIVDSIDELLKKVDVVFLESVDGRKHLEQAKPVIAAGKPMFIDKPMASNLADALEIVQLAKAKNVPIFSSSTLRFTDSAQTARNDKTKFGDIQAVIGWSHMEVEKYHPDLLYYGIHGVESMFTVLGPGCKTVTRVAPNKVVGVWNDGRLGIYVDRMDWKVNPTGDQCGATVIGSLANGDIGLDDNYKSIMVAVVKFFHTKVPPVSAEETLEIIAYTEAADLSKQLGGAPVELADVFKAAEQKVKERNAK